MKATSAGFPFRVVRTPGAATQGMFVIKLVCSDVYGSPSVTSSCWASHIEGISLVAVCDPQRLRADATASKLAFLPVSKSASS
jgi:hypothetical protein